MEQTYDAEDYKRKVNTLLFFLIIVAPVCAIFANPMSRSLLTILVAGCAAVAVISVVLYLWLTVPTDKRIISKMKKMGFKCDLVEGKIIFKRNDYSWRISTYEIKKRYRRTAFIISFTDENLDKDHALTNKLFCIIGSRNPSVLLNWNGTDGYYCSYETVLTSTSDIEREFKAAMSKIDDTLDELYEIFRQAFANRPVEEDHKVGFRMGGKDLTSDDASSEIRAQKETETTIKT